MPQYKIHNLFPTVLYEDHIDVKPEYMEAAKEFNYERMESANGWYTRDKYVLNNNKLKELKTSIIENVERYCYGYYKVKTNAKIDILNSWINIHEPNDWGQSHIHGNSILSGVYYMNTPPESGDISFNRPMTASMPFSTMFHMDYSEINMVNCDNYKVTPSQGMLVIFPSWLQHAITRNNTKEDRYSLAFNVYFRGMIGEDEHEISM